MRIKKNFIKLCALTIITALTFSVIPPIYASSKDEDTSYVVTTYNDRNGLPTGEANTVLHTSDGYIWIGSYGGLIRYDGTEFRNYSLDGSINSSSIRSLYEDSQGRLWIGTNDKGVICLENDVFTPIVSPDNHSFLCIRDFSETSDGTIYVASSSGLAYISDNTLIPFEDDTIKGETIYAVDTDSYDRVWFCTTYGRAGVAKGNTLLSIFTSDMFFRDAEIYSIAASGTKVYLGTSSSQIAELNFFSEATDDYSTKYIETHKVTTHNQLNITPEGHILVSGLTGFYVIFSDGTTKEFTEADNVTSINWSTMDYEGNIWLATSSTGVIRLSEGYFTTTNDMSGLSNISLNAICKSKDYYYIATDSGIYVYNNQWQQVDNQLTATLAGIRVRSAITASDDTVWFATYGGVFSYTPSTKAIVNYNSEIGLVNDRTRVIMEMSDGSIAVGTQTGISIIKDGQIIKNYTAEDGLVNPAILCLMEADDGALIAGSDGDGIYIIKDNIITNQGFEQGLEEGVVLRIAANTDSSGYFVSAGSSLYYWSNSSFTKLTNWDKSAGSIFDMYDVDGRLWILQNNGVISVDKEALLLGDYADTVTYSFNHGLTGSLNANTWNYIDTDNTLYMVTRNGISIFTFKPVDNSEPKAIINSITVDDIIYEHPKNLDINSDVNRITINFAELSYSGTSTLEMEYQLKGFDETPILHGEIQSGSVSYTNLPGGDYTFTLRIYDPNSPDVSTTYTVDIHKAKKLREYPLFWIILVALIISMTAVAIYLIYRGKIKRLQQHQQEYKDIIEQSLQTFAKTIDAKDTYTNGHSIRVAMYSRELAKRLGMSELEQERIYYVGMLHDIGKIGIPDYILTKEGKLTQEEMAIIQTHPAIGGEILKDFSALPNISEGAKYHHERFDGTGYCEGKKGLDIPLVARIIGVADTYDAMSSDRCYRKALSEEVIISELENGSGSQLDPEIVAIMLKMIDEKSVPYTLG